MCGSGGVRLPQSHGENLVHGIETAKLPWAVPFMAISSLKSASPCRFFRVAIERFAVITTSDGLWRTAILKGALKRICPMHQCRTILAATDLSPRANRAARRGAQLAHTHGSALHLALVLREAGDRDLPAPLALESIRDQGEGGCADGPHALLNELASVLQRHYGVEVVRHVLYGRPREALISAASEVSADLMIVGAHGAGFFREFLLGSTAFHLVYRCRQPVLVVKNDVFGPYESVLVGVDLSPDSGRALSASAALAPRAAFTALYAVCLPFESRWALGDIGDEAWEQYRRKVLDVARTELTAFLTRYPSAARVQPRADYGDPVKLLLERTWQGHADLVVVAKHGRGSPHGPELGSVSRRIVEAADCDVLLVGANT